MASGWSWGQDEWHMPVHQVAQAWGRDEWDMQAQVAALAERVDAQEAEVVDYKRRLNGAEETLETLRQEVLEAQDAEARMEKLHREVLEAYDELRDRVDHLEVRAVQEGPPTVPMTFAGALTVPFVSALSTAPGAGAGPAPAPPRPQEPLLPAPAPPQQAPPRPAPAPLLPAPAVPAQRAQPAQDGNLADGLILDVWMPGHPHFRQCDPPWTSPPGPNRCQHAKPEWFIKCFDKDSAPSRQYFASFRDVTADNWAH